MMQYVGLGFLFSLYIFQGLKFALYDLPREKKREAAIKTDIDKVDKALAEACSRATVLSRPSPAHSPQISARDANQNFLKP